MSDADFVAWRSSTTEVRSASRVRPRSASRTLPFEQATKLSPPSVTSTPPIRRRREMLRSIETGFAISSKGILVLFRDFTTGLMYIDPSGLWRRVPEDGLHSTFSHSTADQFGGKSVAEGVWGHLTLDRQCATQFRDYVLYRAGTDGISGISDLVATAECR